ncbi:TonB-dependent receptor [Paucibacter sp. B51]|uniref:TonB-dependent receptor n=1 Tax=Paucibacter sp. B51 TaxID=2993315 RepID=UPI0022EBE862|nr:TonB-dependent receptor [Paucibacter sp. B51]
MKNSPQFSSACLPGAAWQIRPVAAACASLLFAAQAAQAQLAPPAAPASAPAQAQPTADGRQQLEAVVVSGIRRGIEASVASKRNSDSIVEVISAEDIGKLPDVSIADSLSRLPGLTAQRVDGRAQGIQVRGLAGNYAGTLLNGREMVSTSDNRGVEFDQFPSELLSAVKVYKTPDASLVGQGLAGTIDMQTVRPLNFGSRQLVLSGRAENNSNGQVTPGPGANGKRLSASYIDQFADRTIGLAVGFAHLDSPGQETHYKSWWWADTGPWGDQVPGVPKGVATLNGFEDTVTASKQVRNGLMAALEYKPNDRFHSVLDLYYSKFEQRRNYRALMSNLGATWNAATEPVYSNVKVGEVNGDQFVTQATIGNLKPVHLSQYNTRDDDIAALGWNNKWKLGDNWVAVADLSYSRAKRQEQFMELSAGAPGTTSLDINVQTGSGISQVTTQFNYADPNKLLLSDPGGWGRDGRSNYPMSKDEIKALRLSAKRELTGVFSSMELGLNLNERVKNVDMVEYQLNLKNNRAPIAVPASFLLGNSSLGFGGIPAILSYDVMGVKDALYTQTEIGADQTFARHYGVSEKVNTAYVQGNIDTSLFGHPLRGNLGLQYVRTQQESNGFVWDGSKAVPITGGTSYGQWLPSLNLVSELPANTIVRFGLARSNARPRMNDMRAGFTGVGVDATTKTWNGSGGNPTLKPWLADSVDLAFEKYIGKRSYLSYAIFHKHLLNFIGSGTVQYDFTGFPNTGKPPVVPISNIGNLTTLQNGNGGMVAGYEVAASLEAAMLTPALDGFGVVLSYSNTRSNLNDDGFKNGIDGLSGVVRSMTGYYEKNGFSFRVSQRYRSDYSAKTRGIFYSEAISNINSEKVTDMQIGYSFETGSFKGLGLLLQVNNLTDEPYRTSVSVGNAKNPDNLMPERYTTYGRQILLGASYKF